MWNSLIFVIFTSVVVGQRPARQDDASGWDIRLAVPGEPGSDYPTLGNIPRTSFSCAGKAPGYYADTETNCQAFRICTLGSTYGFQSFLCPNGTLFNQAVFVCDWWMNVNCDSTQFTTSEKFGNLRLGPQLMNDVKKMLTHPMRNPYDKSAMKSNLIVMQEYIPPSGQMAFPSAQLQGPKRTPENVYEPTRQQQQQNFNNGFNRVSDNLIAGSTPGPQYTPPQNGKSSQRQVLQPQNGQGSQRQVLQPQNGQSFQRQVLQPQNGQSFQRQVLQPQNGQYVHDDSGKYVHNRQNNQNQVKQPSSRLTAPSRQYVQSNVEQSPQQIGQYRQNTFQVTQPTSGNIISNGLAGRITQATQFTNNNGFVPSTQQGNYQYNPPISTQNYNSQTNQRQSAQYNSNFFPSQPLNNGKQAGFELSYAKQQFNANQEKQPYNYNAPHFSNEITGQVGNDAKQNLVSQPPPTVITKTLTFNRIIQAPKGGAAPKSRITFKTWIVKPSSKSAKLIAESTPYSYNRPTTPPPSEKIILEPTPYNYNKPTTTVQTAKLVSESGYTYSRPTTTEAAKLVAETGYSYNKPTVAAKQVEVIRKTPQPFVPLSTVASTLPTRQYSAPSPSPTVPVRQYLVPTTFKPAVRLYLPPSESPPELSRQYLLPTSTRSDDGPSAKLQASPSTPTPVFAAPNRNNLFSLIKHSRINTNHNNLTFTDILTKEKLDITVNDIVKDTGKILGTATPQSGQLRVEDKPDENPEDVYLPPSTSAESAEILTTNPSTVGPSKSAKLIAKPSLNLLPPDSFETNQIQTTNRIAQLPFIKEPSVPTNTIERTVSLKISIPEKTAAYLFKTCNDSDFDKLEILNTGSSNYLVLTNKIAKNHIPSFIPIGKLIVDKGSNVSDSQALVFSFLADSINQAKEFNTIAEQNLHSTSSVQSHYQNVNNEELAQITNKVAQLTSAQFANSQLKNANIQTTSQLAPRNPPQTAAKYTNQYNNNNAQLNALPQTQQNTQTGQYTGHSGYPTSSNNIESNENQIYSGQLYQIPVPDVSGIYSGQSSAKLIRPSNVQQHTELADLQQHHPNQNGNHANTNNLPKQSSAEVEIVQSQSLPQPQNTPAKLQAAPFQPQLGSQEDAALLANFVPDANGISAQLSDKIVGTISHPSEENKLVTYKKDQSYYVYTKFDHGNNVVENFQSGQINSNPSGQQSAKLTQSSNADNVLSFQFIPSVSYQLDDEKEQQRILNAFQIDEFGSPKGASGGGNQNALSNNVEYSNQQQQQNQQAQYNAPSNLYNGPSSYSAPQASVGRLETNGNYNNNAAKLEQFEENAGYSKVAPARSFSF